MSYQIAYLSLGSNLGDRVSYLLEAQKLISLNVGEVTMQSPIYETEPWGNREQPKFLNKCLAVQTGLMASELLHQLLSIEQQLGRVRFARWTERTIDIDILFLGTEVIKTTDLVLPHPYLHQRRFVLVPLADISPQLIHPVLKKSIAALLADCPDTDTVALFSS
jgi:2-amino-4-hydroxy-6-hydroxymethyldihydropteridine diphosphokinase